MLLCCGYPPWLRIQQHRSQAINKLDEGTLWVLILLPWFLLHLDESISKLTRKPLSQYAWNISYAPVSCVHRFNDFRVRLLIDSSRSRCMGNRRSRMSTHGVPSSSLWSLLIMLHHAHPQFSLLSTFYSLCLLLDLVFTTCYKTAMGIYPIQLCFLTNHSIP